MSTIKIVTIMVFAAMCFVACEEQFTLTPESDITQKSFWQNEDDVKSAFHGMYNQFRSTFDINTVRWGDFRTGYFGHGTSTGTAWVEVWENNLTPTTSGVNWANMYEVINNANLILSKGSDIEFTQEKEKNNILGQAHFIRAFTYFHIAKLWGNAPIVTEGFESAEQNLTPSRSPESELYTLVKDDIEQAINLLSSASSKNYAGVGAAQMLKADVYLWTAKLYGGGESDLQEAKSAVEAVEALGYSLENNFETVFRDEDNSEVIFSLYYAQEELEQGAEHPSRETVPSIQLTPEDLIGIIPTAPNPQWIDLSDYFINNVLNPESLDSRSRVTWRREAGPESNEEATWINKYIGEEFSGSYLPTSDLIIYRFAEALLFKAEIENALGNTGEALNALNRIAERAYGDANYYSGLASEQIDDAILDERIWEFIMEGKIWYDLRRFEEAFERVPSLAGRQGEKSGNILLLPVAQDVLNRNPNITQTEGY